MEPEWGDDLLKQVVSEATKGKSKTKGPMEPLRGKQLLDVIKGNAEAPKEVLLELTGYFSEKDGKKSYKQTDFYKALIEAQGLEIPALQKPSSSGRGGRDLPYVTTVMKNNQVVLGAGYLKKHGYDIGQEFKVIIKKDSIRLVPVRG
jgi:hypothetical protein